MKDKFLKDKLLVEIDMFNGELQDVIPALIYLANELVESGTVEISNPINWNERKGNSYQVKWRFSEDELCLPFDADFAHQLHHELKHLKPNITKNGDSAINSLQKVLEAALVSNGMSLFECEI